MKTNELIDSLARDGEPVSQRAVLRRLALGVGAGALVSFVAMWLWLGFRPDTAAAIGTASYWLKFFFTLGLAVFAFRATERLARPGTRPARAFAGVVAIFAVLAVVAAYELMTAPASGRMPLVMGSSSQVCPWRILTLSIPIFIGTFWSLRALAPTRLTLAGAVAGFASGALGAWIYAFHCGETAAPFILVFFTFGISLAGAAGAAIAARVLRW